MQFIDHISFVDIKDKKILLCRSKGKSEWQLPGGKRERGERDEQTLIRECKEELGIELMPETIKLFDEIEGQAFGKVKGIKVRIKMFTADFAGEPIAGNEVEAAKYFELAEVTNTSEMGWVYLRKLKEKSLIE